MLSEAESSKEITSTGQLCHRFTLDEIKTATRNFKNDSILGRGGFGNVHKGIINNGTFVAIKRLDSNSAQGALQFQTEVEILPMLRHRNIIDLIGCYNDDREMILVYEYMAYGDLEFHLHKHNTPLSWSQRLKIGIDVARGLDYLHNGTIGKGIIHADPKTSNILLDNRWAAKITDFGLSKVIPIDSPSPHVSTTVQGTFGYIDPEYFFTGKISKKSDVYTFGVVLLEMLCRRRVIDISLDEEQMNLVVWAQDCLKKGQLKKIVDPYLRGQIPLKCLNDYAKIAQSCLHSRSELRSTMAEVVVRLESILALHEKTDYSIPDMGITTSGINLQKSFVSSGGRYFRKAVKFLSAKSRQHKGEHGHISDSSSEKDTISQASYYLERSLQRKPLLSYEEIDQGSEPNVEIGDEEFLSINQSESSRGVRLLDFLQIRLDLSRRKDLLHLIWFYPTKKEAEINFGSLVDKFSLLNKYIQKSEDSSRDGEYLREIQTLVQNIEEHLDDAAFDMVAYLPEGMLHQRSESVEFENIATGTKSGQVPFAEFWSDIPDIHSKRVDSVKEHALRCIKDLKVKKLGISGIGAAKVAETLKDLPELKSVFDMVFFVRLKHHSVMELMNMIEEKIHLGKKQSSETRNAKSKFYNFQNCLVLVDCSESFIDLQETEFQLSKWFETVQIVMTSGPHNDYVPFDLEIRVEDHLLPWVLFSTNVDLPTEGKYSSIHEMATRLVEECHGHLLAIILLARALNSVGDVNVWKLALNELVFQQEPSSSELGVTSDMMVRVLKVIWSRMETISRKCIIQFALQYTGVESEKSSLIYGWIGDGLVKSEQEGEHIFEDLIRSFVLEQSGDSFVRMRDEIQVGLVDQFVPRAHGLYLKQDGLKSNETPSMKEWDAREIQLTNNILSKLPDNPSSPILVKLILHSNQDLMDIPITFFENMPSLHVLDLSNTSIKCLPSSIAMLTTLQKLYIRNCDLMMELPPEIGDLKNLKVFDSEGTQLVCLPELFGSLTKLECLKFSLYKYALKYKGGNPSKQIIPDLSNLVRLKELIIFLDSYSEWWEDEAKRIISILPNVLNLESLKLYLPTVELLRIFMETQNWEGVPIYQRLFNFGFIVGHLEQRLISRLPHDLEKMFVKLPKCLKYTNGERDTEVISMALKHSNGLLLDRHWTIESLSTFGLEEIEKLKVCLVTECNEMLEIINGSNLEEYFTKPVFRWLQYLSIHYMKSLTCLWNGPVHGGSLSNLKTLVMHACPELRTVFTQGLLDNLTCLEYLIIEDCEKIKCLVSLGFHCSNSTHFLPSLKKISLLHLPELVSISDGICVGPRLESLVVYNCPNLEKLPFMDVCDHIKEIKGENEWWDALKWCEPEWSNGRPDYLASVFIPLGKDGDIMDELTDAVYFPPHIT